MQVNPDVALQRLDVGRTLNHRVPFSGCQRKRVAYVLRLKPRAPDYMLSPGAQTETLSP